MDEARTRWLVPMAWLGLLALSLMPFFANLYPHDAQRITWTAIMASLGLIGVMIGIRPTHAEWAVFVLTLLVGVSSSMLAKSSAFGLLETTSWLAMLMGVIVLSRAPFSRRDLGSYMAVIALISTIYYLRFALGYVTALLENLPLYSDYLIDGFQSTRFHSQFQTWTLPLLMAAAVLATSQRARGLWMLAATLGWGMLFVSGTRGTLLGLVVSAVVIIWLFREHARSYLLTFLFTAAGGAVLFYLVVLLLPAILGLDNSNLVANTLERNLTSSSGRTELWLHSLGMALEHPWLGAGPMHFACNNPINNGAHPHNVWLQFLAEWGIPFTLAITIGFFYLIFRWITKVRVASSEEGQLALPITASLSAALAHSLFDGIAVMPVSQFYGVLLFGWALAWYRGAKQPQLSAPSLKALPLVLPGLLLLTYVAFSLPGLSAREEAELLLGPGHLQPRFWSQGMICLPGPPAYLIDR